MIYGNCAGWLGGRLVLLAAVVAAVVWQPCVTSPDKDDQ
jgi:hypothetical protein